jgi:hypothetical protein
MRYGMMMAPFDLRVTYLYVFPSCINSYPNLADPFAPMRFWNQGLVEGGVFEE